MKYQILFFALVMVWFAGCRPPQPATEQAEALLEAVEKNLTPPLRLQGMPAQTYTLEERMTQHQVKGVSMAYVQDGQVLWAKGYGLADTITGREVDAQTLFQAGSISKPVAALAALKLVDAGKIDLDTDVNHYLTRWQVPENRFTAEEKVTLRRLLTHTAGLTVHGFPGYDHTEEIPSVEAVLRGEGNTGAIYPDTFPGAIWRYSGGGYTVMQLLVEEVAGEPFADYVHREVLESLGMTNSTYHQPLPDKFHAQASAAFDGPQGIQAEGLWNNYPEMAAAGLWTTPSDLAKYLIEMQRLYQGNPGKVISSEMAQAMLTPHQNNWGLGPSLSNVESDSMLFGHGGKNRGFSNNMLAFANFGDAFIFMSNSDRGTRLSPEVMRSVSSVFAWGTHEQEVRELAEVPEATLARYAGRYRLVQPQTDEAYLVDLQLKEGQLQVFFHDEQSTQALYPRSETEFFTLEDDMPCRIITAADGGVEAVVFMGQYRFVPVSE